MENSSDAGSVGDGSREKGAVQLRFIADYLAITWNRNGQCFMHTIKSKEGNYCGPFKEDVQITKQKKLGNGSPYSV